MPAIYPKLELFSEVIANILKGEKIKVEFEGNFVKFKQKKPMPLFGC